MDFDLRKIVRDELDSSAEADPKIVAQHIYKKLSRKERDLALEMTLPGYVREVAGSERRASHNQKSSASSTSSSSSSPRRTSGPSKRGTAMSAFQKALRQRVHIEGIRAWRRIGDMSADDLFMVAEERKAMGDANHAEARRYRDLGSAVKNHKVETPAALPEKVFLKAWTE
jgi:hypothetical protein